MTHHAYRFFCGLARPKPRGDVCQVCAGSGKEHICGFVCVDLDTPCPTCSGTGLRAGGVKEGKT